MRKALCVGIDNYEHVQNLSGCVNDANAVGTVLERNADGTMNFGVKKMCATSKDSCISRSQLKAAVEELFKSETEVSLFYFAGHGSFDSVGGYLCTSEVRDVGDGFPLNDVMNLAAASKAQNKIIILDSCCSGSIASYAATPDRSVIYDGTVVLAACEAHDVASENNGSGVFTSLLVEALMGGAMNLLGDVSPGSLYAYIDRSLGPWEQRPVFKANIKNFVSLRKNSPPISIEDLRRITELFDEPSAEFKLDPTYEPDKHEADTKEVNKEHESIFAVLQHYVKLNLVVPVGEKHMYYTAIHYKSCKLTALGQHYWMLVKKNII